MTKPTLYISCDIETDGPIPGEYSMLSFAMAAYDINKNIVSTFDANLKKLPDAKEHPDTMNWWSKNQEAYDITRIDITDPEKAMKENLEWINNLKKKYNCVFVAFPAGFDFTFWYWYIQKYTGEKPLGFQALDLKTLAMGLLKCEFKEAAKRNFPKDWFDDLPHTHKALDDAIEQGAMAINMLRDLYSLPRIK